MRSPSTPNKCQAWIESLRIKTLPLACSSVITGSALAFWQRSFQLSVALLALFTAVLLQILSNLANDYGDVTKGSDTPSRIGPLRGMQKGAISPRQMKQALIITVIGTLISGCSLIFFAFNHPKDILGFLGLGLLAIIAAITYTVGNKPYGYLGLGDLSVLIFFGWLGVIGVYYLQTLHFDSMIILPATACGLLATAVLNINNLRDIENDAANGKYTLAVRLGAKRARIYHLLLLIGVVGCFALFAFYRLTSYWGWLFLLAIPLLWHHGLKLLQTSSAKELQPLLVQMVKSALLTNLLFALGVIINTCVR